MDKVLVGVSIFILACIALVTSAVFIAFTEEPRHHVDLTFNWSTLQANVTQGNTATLNSTVFNTDYNYSINARFSAWLTGFNNFDPPWNDSYQQKIINATFNPLIMDRLQPRETRTTTLTIKVADDAPIGTYQFALQGFNNTLNLTVNPK